jgi:diacylglycerol kinase family enzyme
LSIRRYSRGERPKECVLVQAKKIIIESDSEMWIQVDNEYIQDTNVTLSVIPHAVNMVTVKNLSYPIATIQAL